MPPAIPPVTRLMAVGDQVEPGHYQPIARFAHAINLTCGERLISLVTARIGPGPFSLVAQDPGIRNIACIRITPDAIHLDAQLVPRRNLPLYDSSMPPLPASPGLHIERHIDQLARHLRANAPPRSLPALLCPCASLSALEKQLLHDILAGIRALDQARWHEAARLLRGRGFGLTPSGDDFLAGTLIALHLRERLLLEDHATAREAILQQAVSAGMAPLTRTCLTMAARGRVDHPTKQLLIALLEGPEPRLIAAADAVMQHGATSGADFLCGFLHLLEYPPP